MSKDTRKQKFIKLVAQGTAPYQAALKAGYSKSYANSDSHKLREKYENEIEELKPVVEEITKNELRYSVEQCFSEFDRIHKLAILPDEKGNYTNLSAALKAIENKGKMIGAFELDNRQKVEHLPTTFNILPVRGREEL